MTATARWLRIGLAFLMTTSVVPCVIGAPPIQSGPTSGATAGGASTNPGLPAGEIAPIDISKMSEADINALVFIVMMENARAAKEDLRRAMEELRQQGADADKLRELEKRMEAEIRKLDEMQAEAKAKYDAVMNATSDTLMAALAGAALQPLSGVLALSVEEAGKGALTMLGTVRKWLIEERQDLRGLRDQELESARLGALIGEQQRAIQAIGRVIAVIDDVRATAGSASFQNAVSMSSSNSGAGGKSGGSSGSSGGGGGAGYVDPMIDYGGCACGGGGPVVK